MRGALLVLSFAPVSMDPVKKATRNFKDCCKKLDEYFDFELAGNG